MESKKREKPGPKPSGIEKVAYLFRFPKAVNVMVDFKRRRHGQSRSQFVETLIRKA